LIFIDFPFPVEVMPTESYETAPNYSTEVDPLGVGEQDAFTPLAGMSRHTAHGT